MRCSHLVYFEKVLNLDYFLSINANHFMPSANSFRPNRFLFAIRIYIGSLKKAVRCSRSSEQLNAETTYTLCVCKAVHIGQKTCNFYLLFPFSAVQSTP